MDSEDLELFSKAMEDVTPLKNSNKIATYNRQKQMEKTRLALRKARRKQFQKPQNELALDRQQLFNKVGTFEKMLYAQKGVQLREISRLKNGEFQAQAVLDLHGHTETEAESILSRFLADAIADKLRFLRIIHGKGYNSENDYPILKNLTNQLLRQCPQVIAFSSAAEKDGGVGAVNVLLKAQ